MRAWPVTVLVAVLALAGAWAALPFVAQDRCLDAGGAWRDGACEGATP